MIVEYTKEDKMPVKTCTEKGKSGYTAGGGRKCFTGPGSRDKASREDR